MIEFDERLLVDLEAQRQSPSAVAKRGRLLELLDTQPGQRVLDVGCGSGAFSRALAPLVAPHGRVIGIDRAPQAVALAQRLAAGAPPGQLTFECADGQDLPFEDRSFDAAACVSVLEFCDDPHLALTELRRVLRDRGRLLAANSDEDTRVYNGHDRELGRRIMRAVADRGRDAWLGRRLPHLLTSAGLRVVREAVYVDVERRFSPDSAGYIFAHAWREYLLKVGVSAGDYDLWLADLEACDREGSYCYSVVTFACLAEPNSGRRSAAWGG